MNWKVFLFAFAADVGVIGVGESEKENKKSELMSEEVKKPKMERENALQDHIPDNVIV